MTQATPQALNVNINPANSNPIDKGQAKAEIYAQIDFVAKALYQLEQTVRKVS